MQRMVKILKSTDKKINFLDFCNYYDIEWNISKWYQFKIIFCFEDNSTLISEFIKTPYNSDLSLSSFIEIKGNNFIGIADFKILVVEYECLDLKEQYDYAAKIERLKLDLANEIKNNRYNDSYYQSLVEKIKEAHNGYEIDQILEKMDITKLSSNHLLSVKEIAKTYLKML